MRLSKSIFVKVNHGAVNDKQLETEPIPSNTQTAQIKYHVWSLALASLSWGSEWHTVGNRNDTF